MIEKNVCKPYPHSVQLQETMQQTYEKLFILTDKHENLFPGRKDTTPSS